MVTNLKYEVWTEKYRPTSFDDLVFEEKDKLKKLLKNYNMFPHLILYSKSGGTGKGSIYNVLKNETQSTSKQVNSSADTSIEKMRTDVLDFVNTKSFNKKRKLVFLDECDGMSRQSFDSLKGIIEENTKNAVFVLSTNRIEKIPQPIISRCVKIDLKSPNRLQILERLEYICKCENVEYEDRALKRLIQLNYPDIRAMIKTLQDISENGEFPITFDSVVKGMNKFETIWKYTMDGELETARLYILQHNLNIYDLFVWIVDKFREENYEIATTIEVTEYLARKDIDIATSGNPKIHIYSLLAKLYSVINRNNENKQTIDVIEHNLQQNIEQYMKHYTNKEQTQYAIDTINKFVEESKNKLFVK